MRNKIVLLLSVVFLLSGCGLIGTDEGVVENNEPQTLEEAIGVDLISFDDIKSYRALVETTDLEGNESKITVDTIKPDKMHISGDSWEGAFEMITIPEHSYMKVGGDEASWVEIPIEESATSSELLQFDSGMLDDAILRVENEAESIGKVTCGSEKCSAYTFSEEGEKVTIVVSDDKLIKGMKIEAENGEVTEIAFDYDANIKIAAPKDYIDMKSFIDTGTFGEEDYIE